MAIKFSKTDDLDKMFENFASFPDVEKKCVVDSFRKQENQKNHNLHFSEWLSESDHDYAIAYDLYCKLKKTEDYKRSI